MLNTILNGKEMSVNAPVDMALLFDPNNDIDVHGMRFGCRLSYTVLFDGGSFLGADESPTAVSTVFDVGRARMRRIPFTLNRGPGGK
jgi:hypothetical protein